ncbi:CU044_5270 family protein [Streptomyces sp. NPDC007074]|uniref:CU044_5270 family protein n=1 Tax=Streptomyces sp. NPDC007074 TaxID=3156764 RepID=UPI0033EBEC0D
MNPTEREELAGLLPGPGAPVLSSDRLLELEDHLMQEITRGPVSEGRPARPARPRRRFVMTAAPLGAAAVLGTALVAGIGAGHEGPGRDAEAVDLLNRIATVAAATHTTPVHDDQFIYQRTQGTQQIMDKGKDVFLRSDWHAVDGTRDGLARITVLSGPSGRGTREMRLDADPNATTYEELRALPTDPAELYDEVWTRTEGQGPSHEEAALERIGSMLSEATLLPDLDAALYRAAARIPGVSVVDRAEDAAGRHGIGLAFGSGHDRNVWVFDRETLTYLGSDDVALLEIGAVDGIGKTSAH